MPDTHEITIAHDKGESECNLYRFTLDGQYAGTFVSELITACLKEFGPGRLRPLGRNSTDARYVWISDATEPG